jgi:hypothetical protein
MLRLAHVEKMNGSWNMNLFRRFFKDFRELSGVRWAVMGDGSWSFDWLKVQLDFKFGLMNLWQLQQSESDLSYKISNELITNKVSLEITDESSLKIAGCVFEDTDQI